MNRKRAKIPNSVTIKYTVPRDSNVTFKHLSLLNVREKLHSKWLKFYKLLVFDLERYLVEITLSLHLD